MPDKSQSQEAAFRVLVVVSRPLDQKELPTIADQWALVNGLATVKTPAYLHILRPPTIERLRNEILNGYEILHFDGHGSFAVRCPNCMELNPTDSRKCGNCDASIAEEKPHGYLTFEREDGRQDALAAEELADMLRAVPGSPINLVFLSACESGKGGDKSLAATLLLGGVPAVLGMKETVTVEATIALSRALYAALGAGMTIADAFKNSLSALSRLQDSRETGTKARDIPDLLGQGVGMRMVTKPVRGSLIMEKERLIGVPDYDFVGEYIPGHPQRGRKGLLSQAIDALLRGEKLVVLTGQGGIGKSVLAAAAARRLSWHYPGGVFWRSAANTELGLNELLDAFASVFGYEFRTLPLVAKQDAVLGYLGDLQTSSLLVVDNAENISDTALWSFLEGLPKPSAVLVTTREALKREGKQISIHQMEPVEAFRLFVTEAGRRLPGWGEHLNPVETEALVEINRLLDGHPLGIKLASGLLASDSLEMIRHKLRAAPPGEEINKRFDFSYNTLNEGQKELLHRAAAFAGSFVEWAAKAVSESKLFEGDAAKLLPKWREDLSALVQKSFVDVLELHGLDENDKEVTVRRYRLHPLMRQYAAAKAGSAMQVHRRRAAYLFLGFAESAPGYDALENEHDNILAGSDWAYAAKEWELVKRFVFGVDSYLRIRGYWGIERRLLEQALKATIQLKDKNSMTAILGELGNLAYLQGDLDWARESYKEILKIFQGLGNKNGVAQTLHQMGNMAYVTGDMGEARRLYGESLKIEQELGDKNGVAQTLHQMGNMAYVTGDMVEARRLYGESLKI
jgi:predicted ATPase